jgi:shikimate dehydrogenase
MTTARTRVAAVIGAPVAHSLSPTIHNAAFEACGLDWVYVAFEVAAGRGGDAVAAMRVLGWSGLSVTMPHKEDAARAVDRMSPDAAVLGAVNCVVPAAGGLLGENTDGPGFVDALRLECGFEPAGRSAVVVGAGGAARAVVLALARAGAASVTVVNRTPARAHLAARLAGSAGLVGPPGSADGADLVVNATSLGRGGAGEPMPVHPGALGAGQLVVDLVYGPEPTPFLAAAAARGATTADGLGMLVHQAAHSFRLWTGMAAPLDTMMRAARTALDRPPAVQKSGTVD